VFISLKKKTYEDAVKSIKVELDECRDQSCWSLWASTQV